MRKGNIMKRIIFALFLLQKIKFEEIKNYPYKIIYILLIINIYIYIYIYMIV